MSSRIITVQTVSGPKPPRESSVTWLRRVLRGWTPFRGARPGRAAWFMAFATLLLPTWAVATPDFSELDEQVRTGQLGSIKSLLIAREGEILFEGYYRGGDAETLHLVNSVTKSLGATLIGILVRQGKLRLDETIEQVLGYYPWASDPLLQVHRNLTIRQILTMRTGIAWDEWSTDYRDPNNSMSALLASPDWYYHVLTRPRAQPPDTHYTYNTGVSTLMSAIVRARSGFTPQTFAERELFASLGIERFHVEGWSPGGMGQGITQFPFNDAPLGFAWWFTARDLLKLGELYRNGGVVEGRRLLDEEWITAAWTRYSHQGNSEVWANNAGGGYGYQWWLTRFPDGRGRSLESAYADGWGRQYVFVIPELDLTVVTTADDYDYSGPGIGHALRTYILHQFDPLMDVRFNGGWYAPELSGQGINVEVLEATGRAVAYWFTFDDAGAQQWLVGEGPVDGETAQLTLYRPSGGRFLEVSPVNATEVGSATLRFSDCDHGVLDYTIDSVEGSYALQRLTGQCASPLIGATPGPQ